MKKLLWIIALILIVIPLIEGKALVNYLDEIEVELYGGQSITHTIELKNTYKTEKVFEVGIAGEASKFTSVKNIFVLKPSEIVKIKVPVNIPKDEISGIYRGEIVITNIEKILIIPLKVTVKKKLEDMLIFDIVTKETLKHNEDLKAIVQIDDLDRKKVDIEFALKLENKETKNIVLKSGEFFSITKSISKEIIIPIRDDIPEGDYTLIAEANAKTKDDSYTFVVKKDIVIKGLEELPSPKSKSWIWWIIIVFILASILIYATQVYRYEYIFLPWKKGIEMPEKQDIEESYCYLIDEEKNETCFDIFTKLMKNGYKGLCISREHPRHLLEKYDIREAEIKWLTATKAYNVIGPTDLEGIHDIIDEFVDMNDESVILLDGLHYLVVNVSLKQVALLLQYIRDKISTTRSIFLAPIDLEAFDRTDSLDLAKEMVVLDSSKEIIIGEKEVLEVDVPGTLLHYLKTHVKKDTDKEDLKEILVEHGWGKDVIERAFALFEEGVTIKEKKEEKKKEEKKKEIISKESKIEEVIDDMMKELESEVFDKKIDIKEKKKEEFETKKEKTPEEKRLEYVAKLKDDLKRAKELIIEAIEAGHDTTKFDMQLALISHDIEMVRITKDDSHIEEIKKKLVELKRDLVRLKKGKA